MSWSWSPLVVVVIPPLVVVVVPPLVVVVVPPPLVVVVVPPPLVVVVVPPPLVVVVVPPPPNEIGWVCWAPPRDTEGDHAGSTGGDLRRRGRAGVVGGVRGGAAAAESVPAAGRPDDPGRDREGRREIAAAHRSSCRAVKGFVHETGMALPATLIGGLSGAGGRRCTPGRHRGRTQVNPDAVTVTLCPLVNPVLGETMSTATAEAGPEKASMPSMAEPSRTAAPSESRTFPRTRRMLSPRALARPLNRPPTIRRTHRLRYCGGEFVPRGRGRQGASSNPPTHGHGRRHVRGAGGLAAT